MKDEQVDLKVLEKLLDEQITKYEQETTQAVTSGTGCFFDEAAAGSKGGAHGPELRGEYKRVPRQS